MVGRSILLALCAAFAACSGAQEAPSWDRLKAVYDVAPVVPESVKSIDRQAVEGTYTEFSFPSDNGSTAYGTFARPNGKGPFPLVVLLHGLGDSRERMVQSLGKDLLRMNLAFIALDAPHHGQRGTPEDRQTIQSAIVAFASATNPEGLGAFIFHSKSAAMRSLVKDAIEGGVRDIRRALDWVKAPEHRVDSTKIGALGVSMGAMMASILSGVDGRIDADALVIGGDPVAGLLKDVTPAEQEVMSPAAPSLFLGHSTAHVLMLNGYHDQIMRRPETLTLYESAPGATLVFFDVESDLASQFGHAIPAEGYGFALEWLSRMVGVPKPATREHAEPAG
jgi:dienelactone hydrolase